ncbi:MAG: serine/threonine-protein kinase [Raoultibacter sp.]
MTHDELSEYLSHHAHDACYRVAEVLKTTPYETTQKVYFVGKNGAEQGPFIRKYISQDAGLGCAYENLYAQSRAGTRFACLPRVFEYYALEENNAIIMECVPGETLQAVVGRCGASSVLAADLFPCLCDAVSEMHTKFDPPLIHRDLKPSNVMVSQETLTIIDFGIARTFKQDGEEDTHHFGTRAYAPPEQFGFGQTDVRSDVYALGMLLYFCLTGKTADGQVRKQGFVAPQVPPGLRQVLVRATELDPQARFQSAEELKRAFQDALVLGAGKPAGGEGQKEGKPPAFAPPNRKPFLARIPVGVGIVWDVFLALTLVLFFVAAFQLAFLPTPASSLEAHSLTYRLLFTLVMMVFIFVPALYLMSDRRPLRRLVPVLASVSLRKELLACALSFCCAFFLLALLGVALPSGV